MNQLARIAALAAMSACATVALAKAPASAPAGTTGLCKDGSYSSAAEKTGACSGHGGVKKWYGASDATAASNGAKSSAKSSKSKHGKETAAPAAAAPATPAPAARAAAPATSAAPAAPAASAHSSKVAHAPPAVAAPGGGNGQVWVNKDTKVYHCPGDKWYGKTKQGAYMSESSAVSQGYHADHGKACQQ